VGPGGTDGIGQALEAVAAHDEGVLHATVGELGVGVGPQRPARLSPGGFLWPALRTGRAASTASGSPLFRPPERVFLWPGSPMVWGCGCLGSGSARWRPHVPGTVRSPRREPPSREGRGGPGCACSAWGVFCIRRAGAQPARRRDLAGRHGVPLFRARPRQRIRTVLTIILLLCHVGCFPKRPVTMDGRG
jgi:hypothetical protein